MVKRRSDRVREEVETGYDWKIDQRDDGGMRV